MCEKEEYYNDLINKHGASKAGVMIAKLPVIRTPAQMENLRQERIKRMIKEEKRIRMIENAQKAKAEYGQSMDD